jgi:hypothetical protein
MNGNQGAMTKVTVTDAGGGPPRSGAALASLCAAVERTVEAHRPSGFAIREVVVRLEEVASSPAPAPEPVYVDVNDSGYGHGI